MIKSIKNFFGALAEEISEIHFASASLAYSTLLSVIPFLIIVIAVFQSGVGLEKLYPKIELLFTTYLKETTGTLASDYVRKALTTVRPKALGATGILLLLFTSLGLIRSIDTAFHKMWKIKVNRPIHQRLWYYWVVLLIIPVCLALSVGMRSVGYFNRVSITLENQFQLSIWIALFLWLLYKVIPSVKVSTWASMISAILASVALNLVQDTFIWASLTIFKKNKVYGSLASFPIFLLWLLVVWIVILCGVSLCAFLQQRIFKKLN